MTFSIENVDNFPQITRSGRASAELQSIIDSLIDSSKTGAIKMISNVEPGKKFNSLQQRIRAQAKKLDLKVTIHFDKNEMKLFYRCPSVQEINAENTAKTVTAKEVKSVKTSSKNNA